MTGSFYVESSVSSDLLVALTIEDETNVESFEIESPEGRRETFPTYSSK